MTKELKQKVVTRQQAINKKCRDCMYDNLESGNWRQQVSLCTSLRCALWPYRPQSSSLPEGSLSSKDALYVRRNEPNRPDEYKDLGLVDNVA
jgi:hypothetical protein